MDSSPNSPNFPVAKHSHYALCFLTAATYSQQGTTYCVCTLSDFPFVGCKNA